MTDQRRVSHVVEPGNTDLRKGLQGIDEEALLAVRRNGLPTPFQQRSPRGGATGGEILDEEIVDEDEARAAFPCAVRRRTERDRLIVADVQGRCGERVHRP